MILVLSIPVFESFKIFLMSERIRDTRTLTSFYFSGSLHVTLYCA